jgi:hypothetical protein
MGKTVKQALIAAADWLEANPERHTTSYLALDSQGRTCNPDDPDAQCFCGVGRVAKELGVTGTRVYDKVDEAINERLPRRMIEKPPTEVIVRLNDQGGRDRQMVCNLARPASHEAVTYLRKLAARI